MLGRNSIEQALHITPAVSNKMIEAIELWTQLYKDEAPWLHEPTFKDPTLVASLGLPAFIASEKARMAVLELKSEITAPKETVEEDNPKYYPPTTDMFGNVKVSGQPRTIITDVIKSPTERAEFMNTQYQSKLMPKLRTQLEYGIAKGSLIIKPRVVKSKQYDVAGLSEEDLQNVPDKYDIEYDFIQADCFYPFSFDSNGNLIEVAFVQTKIDKDTTYTRLEYHKLEGSTVTIINKAYMSQGQQDASPASGASLGREIPLTSVWEWRNLPPQATIKNVDRLLFGYFKMPDANTIDPHSPLGISGFARAVQLIREADKQYSRLLWEYEGGELAIDIDRDALMQHTDENGNVKSIMTHLQQRLYRTVDLGESDTYKPYSPALRDASMINGLNTILMRIEDVCALSRGTISEVASEARTATELKILRQRSYSSNAEIQKALEVALRDVIYAMNVHCTIYNIVGDIQYKDSERSVLDVSKMGQYEVSFTWDDSIIVDVDTELNKRIVLLGNGITSKEEVRMWYFGETLKQAREALDKIKEESRDAIEQNMLASSQMGQAMRNQNGNNPSDKSDKSVKSETEDNDETTNVKNEQQKETLSQK